MGTRFDIVISDVDRGHCEKVYNDIRDLVLGMESRLSFFHPQSDVYILNRMAHAHPVVMDKETFSVLEKSLEYHRLTSGAFDICKAALKHKDASYSTEGVEAIRLNIAERSVFFTAPHLKIDLGGMGKGLALECVKEVLERECIPNALVSFGDSSVLAMGSHPKGDCWKVGIRSYHNPAEYLCQFELRDMSLSTSGNFYYRDDGAVSENHHIINPETNALIKKRCLVSVVSSSPLDAEVFSTALFVKSEAQAAMLSKNFNGLRYSYFSA